MLGSRTQVGGEEAQGRVGQNNSLRLRGLATSGSSFFNRRAARKRGEDVGGEVWLPPTTVRLGSTVRYHDRDLSP